MAPSGPWGGFVLPREKAPPEDRGARALMSRKRRRSRAWRRLVSAIYDSQTIRSVNTAALKNETPRAGARGGRRGVQEDPGPGARASSRLRVL